jgi:DNA-binding IclR family transcriptional regulator
MTNTREMNTLQTLDRGLVVLELLIRNEMGPTEVARSVGVDRATVHRILRTLIERGYVERVSASGRYRANLRHLLALTGEMGAGAQSNWMVLAKSSLEELNAATGLTANLCVPSGNEIVYLMQILGEGLSVHRPAGTRVSLHCSAVGKAYLGSLPEPELQAILATLTWEKHTETTITSTSDLRLELEKSRARDYYVDHGEHNPRVKCIAAPVFDQFGRAIAALGVSGPVDDLGHRDEARLGGLVANVARAMSSSLGHRSSKEMAALNMR